MHIDDSKEEYLSQIDPHAIVNLRILDLHSIQQKLVECIGEFTQELSKAVKEIKPGVTIKHNILVAVAF